jgi:hypothetical protein
MKSIRQLAYQTSLKRKYGITQSRSFKATFLMEKHGNGMIPRGNNR